MSPATGHRVQLQAPTTPQTQSSSAVAHVLGTTAVIMATSCVAFGMTVAAAMVTPYLCAPVAVTSFLGVALAAGAAHEGYLSQRTVKVIPSCMAGILHRVKDFFTPPTTDLASQAVFIAKRATFVAAPLALGLWLAGITAPIQFLLVPPIATCFLAAGHRFLTENHVAAQ